MNSLSIDQIAQFAQAGKQNGHSGMQVTRLSTDSRTTQPGDLFVALGGANFDGHRFVNDAFLRGAIGAVVEGANIVGTKTWAHTAGGATPLVTLWNSDTGKLEAIVEAFAQRKR